MTIDTSREAVERLIARLRGQDPIPSRNEVADEVAALLAERDEADRRAGAAERGWEADKETLATYRRHRDKLKEERGYNPNVSFDTVWKETCAKADAALILAPDTLRQVMEAADFARNRLEMLADDTWNGDARDLKRSLAGIFTEYDAALALLMKE
jgi:hypothetical protein